MIRVNDIFGVDVEIGDDYILLDGAELAGIADLSLIDISDDTGGAEIREARLRGVRKKRDALLTDSDKYMISDYPITTTQRELWKAYRQALRDLTAQLSDSLIITWPAPPEAQ